MGAPDMIVNGTAAGGPPIGGTGTPNTIPRWTGASTLGDSIITQTGVSRITIGSGGYAGASLDGVRLTNGVNSYFAASDGTRTVFIGADGNAVVGTLTAHDVKIRAGNADAITVQQGTLNVGIGTASPAAKLHASFADATVGTLLSGATKAVRFVATATQMSIDGIDNTGLAGFQQLQINGLPLLLATAGVERARIDSAGNLVVGLAASASSTDNRLQLANSSTAKQGMEFRPGVALSGGSTGSLILTYDRNASAYQGTDWNTLFVKLPQNNSYFDASASGGGLKLPATPGNTDPNTLDAYEDGGTAGTGGKTWTPTDTSGAGLTLTVTKAQYIRVGKQITFAFELTYPVTADATNAAISVPVTGITNWAASGVVYINALGLRMWMISGGNLYFYTTAGLRMTNAQLSGLAVYGGSSYIAA